MSRVTDGNFSISRKTYAAGVRFETANRNSISRHEHRSRSRRSPRLRGRVNCPAKPIDLRHRAEFRPRARDSRLSARRNQAAEFATHSIAPFRSNKSSRRCVAARQCGRAFAFPQKTKPRCAFFLARRAAKKRDPVRKCERCSAPMPEIARQHFEQPANQTRPQRDMVFAQRIAQFDRVFPESDGRDAESSAEVRASKIRRLTSRCAQLGFEIVRAIRLAQRSEPAAIAAGTFRRRGRERLPRSDRLRAGDRGDNSGFSSRVSSSRAACFR